MTSAAPITIRAIRPAGPAIGSTTDSRAPASGQQTVQSNCGSITVTWTGANISLTATQPAAGFSPEIENAGPEEIKVKFDNGDAKCEIEAQIEAGTLVTEVENDDGD